MYLEYRVWNYNLVGGRFCRTGRVEVSRKKDALKRIREAVRNSSEFDAIKNLYEVILYDINKKRKAGKWNLRIKK